MSKAPLGQMIIELGLDSTDFGKGLTSAKREVRTWSNEMSASMRAADLAGNKIGKLQARYDGLTKIISAQQKQVDSLKQSYENSFVDGKATAQTEKLASQLKRAEADLITYNKELRNAAGELAKVRVQTEGVTGALRKSGEGLQKFGKGATAFGDAWTKGVSLPLMAGVTLATKAAMDWESSFAGVMKTNDEVIDSNGNVVYSYKDLEDGLRDMASELPATHAEIAEVAEAAGQLGIEAENVTSFTRTMIDMGESTNLGAEEAANALARLANITGMSQTDFDRLGSAIVGLGNNFATTEAEITNMALRLAGTGNQIGMSEADILALAAAMSSVGIQAEAGGTAMSTVLKKIQNAVADNSEELKLFADVADVSAKEFAKAFEDDPARALQLFVEGLEQSSNEGENLNSILDDLGIKGIREADTLLRLAGNSQLLGNALDMSAEAWEENTALAEEAQTRYETLESQLGMLRNEAVDVAIDFGGPLVKALREALEAAKPLLENVSELAKAFAEADEETQQSIVRMVGFGIATGPVISTVGRLATGIGGATVKTIDFLAEMAKKKAIADFGGAAATASGAKGVGAMTGALSTLNPWLIGLVGAGGLLAVGYGAWKLWGEEAYEAGQRTKRWGTDVGEAVDETLTDMKRLTNETSGQFGLMQQGFSTNTEQMGGDFERLGQTIERSLVERISNLDELINSLPETVRHALIELLEEDKKQAEESLAIVKENNARISEIRQAAFNENRELTIFEAKQLQDLNKESAEAYVNTLKISQEERKTILNAMNGDVENATKEEARIWAQSLAEQRQEMKLHHNEQKEIYLQALRDEGYSDAALEEHAKIWDEANNAMSLGLEQQLAIIAEKYPEIAEEIYFANGQMIDANDEAAKSMIEANQEIINSAISMSATMEDTAIRNADRLKWMGDEATNAGQTWNSIILDEKTGEVKTNVREEVIEAAKDAEKWNHMRFQLKNADLDSNARLIIGEAAIMNGWWEGMAWEDKEAVLKDNFSVTLYEAIVANGVWDSMEPEEKTAVLRNEFSQTVAQSLIDIGRWDSLDPKHQKAILLTNTPETLIQVMKDIGIWETLPIEVRDLIANATPAKQAVREAERVLDDYGDIQVGAPVIRVQDNATQTVKNIQAKINNLEGKKVYIDAIARAGGSASSRRFIESGGRLLEKGTNYHQGGPAMVNDQKGSMFRELIQHPDGTTYIPYGRNVILDLPRGSKVLKASLTKQRFPNLPQYRDGIGNIPVESTVIQNVKNARATLGNSVPGSIQMERLLREIIRRLDEIKNKKNITEINQTNHIEGVKPTERELARENKIVLEQLAYKLGLT